MAAHHASVAHSELHSTHTRGGFIWPSICKYRGYVTSCQDSSTKYFFSCTVAFIARWDCYIIHPVGAHRGNINRSIHQNKAEMHKSALIQPALSCAKWLIIDPLSVYFMYLLKHSNDGCYLSSRPLKVTFSLLPILINLQFFFLHVDLVALLSKSNGPTGATF